MRPSCIPTYASYLENFFLLEICLFLNTIIFFFILWKFPVCSFCSSLSHCPSSISPWCGVWEVSCVFLRYSISGECSVEQNTGVFCTWGPSPAERWAQAHLFWQPELRQSQESPVLWEKWALTHSTTAATGHGISLFAILSLSLNKMACPAHRQNILDSKAQHFLHVALPFCLLMQSWGLSQSNPIYLRWIVEQKFFSYLWRLRLPGPIFDFREISWGVNDKDIYVLSPACLIMRTSLIMRTACLIMRTRAEDCSLEQRNHGNESSKI